MYFGALIQFPGGSRKAIEKSGYGALAILKFIGAIGDYAKKENKLVKVLCNDYKTIVILRKMLPGVNVEYGAEEMLKLELEMHQNAK